MTGTFYHLEGSKCPNCSEKTLMYGNPGDGTYVECDNTIGGCGESWGPLEESDWYKVDEIDTSEELAKGFIQVLNKVVECGWCGWKGTKYKTKPLGKMTEDSYEETIGTPWNISVRSMNECPDCGEPGPI